MIDQKQMMGSPTKTAKEKSLSSKENLVLILFNHFYLVLLGSGIAIGFLPIRILKDIDEIAWTYPTVLTAVFLTWFFLFINRKAISEILAEFFFSSLKKTIPGQSIIEKLRHTVLPKYILCVSVLVITAFMIFSYRLGAKDFWDDEYLILRAAKGYYETGTYYSWDFIKDAPSEKEYKRAWPHTFLVAQSYKLFGVSEWSTRIVSVLSGCIFIGTSFFVCIYFTGNLLLAFIIAIVFLLNPDFIYYWRYARMYALLLPIFFIWAFFVFKAIEEPCKGTMYGNQKQSFFSQYFDFNWFYVGLSILFLYIVFQIHIIAMILPLATLFYILISAFFRKNRKFMALLVVACTAGLILFFTLPERILDDFKGYFLFFKAFNPIYVHLMVQRPFYSIVSLSLMSGAIIVAILFPCSNLNKKILFWVSIVLTTIVFFVYMANFYGNHYRFISHTVPFAILLVCVVYFIILKIYKNKYILAAGLALLLFSQANNWIRLHDVLYHGASNQPFPSIAYKTVINNLKKDEAIFVQGLKDYYMAGIPANTPVISLGHLQKQDKLGTNPYNFELFFNDLLKFRKGWIVWEKFKEFHIDPKVAAYAKALFKKHHGPGIDNTGVDVYYFDESMIKIPNFK